MAFTDADQIEMFGCTQAASRHGIDDLVSRQYSRHGNDAARALASILSDAQSLMEMGRIDAARQYLNRVKDALFDAAPFTLWTLGPIKDNAEIANECSESIRLAARKAGHPGY